MPWGGEWCRDGDVALGIVSDWRCWPQANCSNSEKTKKSSILKAYQLGAALAGHWLHSGIGTG